MRLLNTESLEIEFIPDDKIASYAILSHTWGDHELSLQEMQSLEGYPWSTSKLETRKRPGLEKVISAASLAASQGYRWLWIDTCCIDKTSSAELSEAINSMYRWYKDAGVCYVFIDDTPKDRSWEVKMINDDRIIGLAVLQSRWVTRGWTLQELVAPKLVKFYSAGRIYMGQKSDQAILDALVAATGVEIEVLTGEITVAEVSVANRMKWAARRQTTRPEDLSYCLMGLFGVNMPLLYGEGATRAFIRLQEHILKATDDQSIFAWKLPLASTQDDDVFSGLLADSPSFFQTTPKTYSIPMLSQSSSSVPWSMANKGLQVQLYLIRPRHASAEDIYLAVLDCFTERSGYSVNDFQESYPAIYLRRLWGDQYTRIRAYLCESVPENLRYGGNHVSLFANQNLTIVLPRVGIPEFLRLGDWMLEDVCPRRQWNEDTRTFQLEFSRAREIQGIMRFKRLSINFDMENTQLDIVIALHRTNRDDLKPICFPTKTESDLQSTYHQLSLRWIRASITDKDSIREEHKRFFDITEIMKAVRAGRGLFLLTIRPRQHREAAVVKSPSADSATAPWHDMDGQAPDGESFKKKRTTTLTNQVSFLPGTELIWKPLECYPYPRDDGLRRRLKNGLWEMTRLGSLGSTVEKDVCQAILDNDARETKAFLTCNMDYILVKSSRTNPEGFKMIHIAILCGRPEMVSILAQMGQSLMETNSGFNPLHLASILGDWRVVRSILQHEPSLPDFPKDTSRFRPYFGATRDTGDTSLHLAAMYCSGEQFSHIIEEIQEATGVLKSDWSTKETLENFEYLVELRNSHGETVLHRAVTARNLEVVKVICQTTLKALIQLDDMSRSVFWHAAYEGDPKVLRLLWDAGLRNPDDVAPFTHVPDDDGLSPMHVACWKGHALCIPSLVLPDFDWQKQTRNLGLTPLHYAALFGHDECLRVMINNSSLLLSSGLPFLNLDMTAPRGPLQMLAPIHLAAANGWLECVKILATSGASITSETSYYYVLESDMRAGEPGRLRERLMEVVPLTPQDIAIEEGHIDVAAFLRTVIDSGNWQ